VRNPTASLWIIPPLYPQRDTHGFTHSDHPNVSCMGSTTIDVRYQKSRGGDQMKVTIHTPKEKIQLIGKVMGAGAVLPSCS